MIHRYRSPKIHTRRYDYPTVKWPSIQKMPGRNFFNDSFFNEIAGKDRRFELRSISASIGCNQELLYEAVRDGYLDFQVCQHSVMYIPLSVLITNEPVFEKYGFRLATGSIPVTPKVTLVEGQDFHFRLAPPNEIQSLLDKPVEENPDFMFHFSVSMIGVQHIEWSEEGEVKS